MQNKNVIFQDWGLVDYQQAWDRQENLFSETIRLKTQNRNLSPDQQIITNNYLVFCEHPHVYTLGKSGKVDHLLLDDEGLEQMHASFYKINRGGDITYHGPGQLVGYPILDLDHFFTDIHKYLRLLEEAIILTLADYGIKGGRVNGFTGVWIDGDDPIKARKICAMGVRCSRWVTMHGFAFNIAPDLSYFKNIVPCGIDDKAVTSMQQELGKAVNMEEIKAQLKKHIKEVFEMELLIGTEPSC